MDGVDGYSIDCYGYQSTYGVDKLHENQEIGLSGDEFLTSDSASPWIMVDGADPSHPQTPSPDLCQDDGQDNMKVIFFIFVFF